MDPTFICALLKCLDQEKKKKFNPPFFSLHQSFLFVVAEVNIAPLSGSVSPPLDDGVDI